MENAPANSEKTENPVPVNGKKLHAIWLVLAAIALVAAFLSQWKNSLDMAAIASTDDERTVRVENPGENSGEDFVLRILLANALPGDFAGALLCNDSGKILARLEADFPENAENSPAGAVPAGTQNRTRVRAVFADENARAAAAREHFLRVVLPALRNADGEPIVLVLPN